MNRLLKLILLFLILGLIFILFTTGVAGSPDSLPLLTDQTIVETGPDPQTVPTPSPSTSDNGPITIQNITGLSISHSSPVLVNIPVTFTATIESGTPPIEYSWSFGDGASSGPSSNPIVAHTYAAPGTYQVTVTARNVVGSRSTSILLTVLANPITGLSIAHSSPALINVPTSFTATVSGGSLPISYAWSFGDDTPPQTNAGPTIAHTYDMTGTYTVVVTALNVVGPVVRSILLEVTAEPISGLVIAHSSPALVNGITHFTATVASGSSPISYAWDFGDGSRPLIDVGSKVSHIYIIAGDYTVLATAYNGVGSPVTEAISITLVPFPIPRIIQHYLPVIMKDVTLLPDLVCGSLSVTPDPSAPGKFFITTQISNQGDADADGFWVDLYINPTVVPKPGNRILWQDVCGPDCPGGIAWRISNKELAPGTNRILASLPRSQDPDGYAPAHTDWDGFLPTGTHNLYVYVDSVDNPALENTDGAVQELDEANNRCDLKGLVVSGLSPAKIEWPRSNKFPARPVP